MLLKANYIILTIIAVCFTNVYFIVGAFSTKQYTTLWNYHEIPFWSYFFMTNLALMVCALAATQYIAFGKYLRVKGYGALSILCIKTGIMTLLFGVTMASILWGYFYLQNGETSFTKTFNALYDPTFLGTLSFFAFVSVLMFFVSNLERRFGSAEILIRQSIGKMLRPKKLQKGFLFIDLNNATTMAETLGSTRYSGILRKCFQMLNELVIGYGFSIYQFVGDEAIVVFDPDAKNSDYRAISFFQDFKAYIKEQKQDFLKEFNWVPEFKCAIHSGEVIKSEIGKDVKHLVYHGDTLNTCARILSQCHSLNTDLLISSVVLKSNDIIRKNYVLQNIGEKSLKGKVIPVRLYAVHLIVSETPKTFFLIKDDYRSHYFKAKNH